MLSDHQVALGHGALLIFWPQRGAGAACIESAMVMGVLKRWQAGVIAVTAVVAMAPQAKIHTTMLCRPYQHITTAGGSGAGFVVRNDDFGGLPECLSNVNDWSNFKVRTSKADAGGAESMAYPNIFRGCSWGLCSPRSGLPARAGRLQKLSTSWYTTLHASGRWAAAYDIWFDRKNQITGQNNGAELMIWLNTRGFPADRAPIVRVDHTRWRVQRWVVIRGGKRWNYIQFRRVHPTNHVHRLGLVPFIRVCQRYGWIRPSWWLTSVEAGFEIWRGGAGLATTRFWTGQPHR